MTFTLIRLSLFNQAMLRALSRRRSNRGYEQLADESATSLLEVKLQRTVSVPAQIFGSRKFTPEFTSPDTPQVQAKPAKKINKIHPLFSLFYGGRKKKTTAKPEFARYLEYVKEGGMWDANSNMPIIHYK